MGRSCLMKSALAAVAIGVVCICLVVGMLAREYFMTILRG